jgi:hypothetical protein
VDSCYELRLLNLFCKEYIAKQPDGEALELHARYLAPTVALIVNGRWDEAYAIYRAMCEDMENRYLCEEPTSGETL